MANKRYISRNTKKILNNEDSPERFQCDINILTPYNKKVINIDKIDKTVQEYQTNMSVITRIPYVITFMISVEVEKKKYFCYNKESEYIFGQIEHDILIPIIIKPDIIKPDIIKPDKILEQSSQSPRLYYFGRVAEDDIKNEETKIELSKLLEVLANLLQSKLINIKNGNYVNITYVDILYKETEHLTYNDVKLNQNLSIKYNKGYMDFDKLTTTSELIEQLKTDEQIIIFFDYAVMKFVHNQYKLFKYLYELNDKIIIIFPEKIYNFSINHIAENTKYFESYEVASRALESESEYKIIFIISGDHFTSRIFSIIFDTTNINVLKDIKNDQDFIVYLSKWIIQINPNACFNELNYLFKLWKIGEIIINDKIMTIRFGIVRVVGGSMTRFSTDNYNKLLELFNVTDRNTQSESEYINQFDKGHNVTLMCSKQIYL